MSRILSTVCLLALALSGVAGCVTPARRARENAVAFGRLSPGDRQLVLHGRVRVGLDREAVLIAWGSPDQKHDTGPAGDGKEKRAGTEIWTYRHQLTIHAPIGSYDQWQPGNSLTPPGTPLLSSPGYGFGGSGYEGWLLYQPRVQYTDSYVRRAAFVDGKLDSFQTWYGELPPLP